MDQELKLWVQLTKCGIMIVMILLDDDHIYDKNICKIFLDAFLKEKLTTVFI